MKKKGKKTMRWLAEVLKGGKKGREVALMALLSLYRKGRGKKEGGEGGESPLSREKKGVTSFPLVGDRTKEKRATPKRTEIL